MVVFYDDVKQAMHFTILCLITQRYMYVIKRRSTVAFSCQSFTRKKTMAAFLQWSIRVYRAVSEQAFMIMSALPMASIVAIISL